MNTSDVKKEFSVGEPYKYTNGKEASQHVNILIKEEFMDNGEPADAVPEKMHELFLKESDGEHFIDEVFKTAACMCYFFCKQFILLYRPSSLQPMRA